MRGFGGATITRHIAIRDAIALLAREQHAHTYLELDVDESA